MHHPGLRRADDGIEQQLVAYRSRGGVRRIRIARQQRAVVAHQLGVVVGIAAEHLAVEIAEIGRRHADQDDPGKLVRIVASAAGDREHILAGEPAEHDAADIEWRMRFPQRLEIVAVAKLTL